MVVPDGAILRQTIQAWTERAWRGALRSVEASRGEVANFTRRMESGLPDLDHLKRQVDDLAESLGGSFQSRLRLARLEVDGLEGRLRTLDPAATLRRGFAVVQRGDTGQVISAVGQVSGSESLTITVADGTFPAVVGDGTGAQPQSANTPAESSAKSPGDTQPADLFNSAPTPPARNSRRRRPPPEPPGMERLI